MLTLLESTRHLRRGIRMVACVAAVWVLLGSREAGDMAPYVIAGMLGLSLLIQPTWWRAWIVRCILLGVVLGLFLQIIHIDVWMAAFIAALGVPLVSDMKDLLDVRRTEFEEE